MVSALALNIASCMGRIHLLFPKLCKCLGGFSRTMATLSSPRSSDHLTSTQSSSRKDVISAATVQEIREESETVKVLTLKVHDPNFSFKAGQWVDTFIPGVDTVGGYSMCSSPSLLASEGILILAVKFSKHPPALWIHTKCLPGAVLQLRAGGDFFYDPGPGDGDVLLVAGGVGVNPLLSMLNHAATLTPLSARLILLYSASHTAQLIFKKELENLSAAHDNINVHFFITREPSVPAPIKAGRISCTDIQNALQELEKEKLKVFLCGPAPMISDIEQFCIDCGVSKKKLFYERWW